MRFLTSVPKVFGKGLQVWLGVALFILVAFQIYSGLQLAQGQHSLNPYHRFSALYLIIPIGLLHAYYGIGIWFFGFKYADAKKKGGGMS